MVKSRSDKLFNGVVSAVLALSGLAVLLPMLYIVSVSVTPLGEVLKHGGFILVPRSITFDAYTALLNKPEIPQAFKITLFITVAGTLVNLALTALMAYPLSRKGLPGRKFLLLTVVFTLLFNGGLIPTYLIVRELGMLDSVWAMIIPNAVWSFNLLIMKSFFENLPEELFESARMDGAKEYRVLFKIVLPLSLPVMMTVGLFYMVGHWNEFFQALFYITDQKLYPLQVIVRNILLMSQQPTNNNPENMLPTQTLEMAAVLIATVPVLCVYPFIQKYFTKGMLLGSIKG